MANNDVFLIDGIIDEMLKSEGIEDKPENRGKVFEEFALSQILKTYDLSSIQLKNGLVDGGDDGGIDGFYIFANGVSVTEKSTHPWPRSNAELEVYIMTCKHHQTFELNALESLDSSISELFDLRISSEDLKSKYNVNVINKRESLMYAYRKLAPVLERCRISVIYASRGSSTSVADNIRAKGNKVKATCESMFQQCEADVTFWGAEELIVQYRKKRNAATDLKAVKVLQSGKHLIALSRLVDYYAFISDDDGKLKRYYFEENVRDYLGKNRTNTDILRTLESEQTSDFWLLNNGITLLVSSAVPYDGRIEIENVQIVNGLQTTSTIYQHFSSGGTDHQNRSILIKIIESSDEKTRNEIIQATNNQSSIPLHSLHATDKIQKDIEDIMLQYGLYYERKDRYYANLGYSNDSIFAPLYLASGYIGLVLKLPHRAVKVKAKFMNNPAQYEKVFSTGTDIRVWPQIAQILRLTDIFTKESRASINTSPDKYLKFMRPLVSLTAVSRVVGKFSFGVRDLVSLDIAALTDEIMQTSTTEIVKCINSMKLRSVKNAINKNTMLTILREVGQVFSITGIPEIENRKDFIFDDYEIDDEFLALIAEKLTSTHTSQTYYTIAKQLGCPTSKVYRAVELLGGSISK